MSKLVKVDHHITAENDIKRTPHGPLSHQIQPGEVDAAAQQFNDLIAPHGPCLNASKVFGYQ